MTHNDHTNDAKLDKLVTQIHDEELPEDLVTAATGRVWERIGHELHETHLPLRSCADFQAELPAYLAGELSEARALLVKDHTRECVPCRRALLQAQRPAVDDAPTARRPRRLASVLRFALAAAVLAGAIIVGYYTTANFIADHSLSAQVAAVGGSLQIYTDEGMVVAGAGTGVRAQQLIRTGKDSDAVIELDDGSEIEMDERSEITLRGSHKGTSINLTRGNVIVHAAPQGQGRLYVATNDCLVAVKGTIFSVNHGLKGSRVSVIEGEVEVSSASGDDFLLPGDQVTTDAKLARVDIADEIAWSRNKDAHLALLAELTSLQQDMADAADIADRRTSTELLDIAPADTVVYVALPNMAEGLSAASQVFEEHLAKSEALRTWYEENIANAGVDDELNQLLERLQPYGNAIGEELAAAIPAGVIADSSGPVLLALLDDPTGFATLLEEDLDRMSSDGTAEQGLTLVTDPWQAEDTPDGWLAWIEGRVFVVARTAAELQHVAAALANPSSNAFTGTRLYARLADAYRSGVSWLVGVDIQTILETAVSKDEHADDDGRAMLEQLGLLDATTLVFERHREGDMSSIQAVLDFDGPRRGISAWLDEAAPMASLDFISPDATLVSAVLTKDAADMFDDVMTMLRSSCPEALVELADFESAHGISLHSDIAATLGGEAALAQDGPMLPIPSWKLIVEVYDPAGLEHAIETAVAEINRELEAQGQALLSLTHETSNGLAYHTLTHEGTGLSVVYTMVDGFLVAAPHKTLIDTALQYRSSGVNLASSQAFQSLLPANGYTGFSAVVYRNLSQLAALLSPTAVKQLPEQAQTLIAASSKPSVFCIYGEPDRIIMNGSGGTMLSSASLLGLPGLWENNG